MYSKSVSKEKSLRRLRRNVVAYLALLTLCVGSWVYADDFTAYDLIRDEGTNENRRGTINFIGAGVSVADDSANNETEVTISGGAGAPDTSEYVVTEADASLSAEVAPSATDQVPNSSSSTAGSWTNSPNLLDLTLQGAGPDLSFIGTGLNTMGLHQDGDSSLVFRNETNAVDILYLKPGGSLRLPGYPSCNLDTDASGLVSCGSDATGSSNSFETIDVPAGTDPVAGSATDTLTITETSFLTITGTAATDTIAITQVTTDLGTDGLIAADAVALGTDTTNAYVADLTAGTYIDVSGGGAETANVTVTVDPTEVLDVTFAAGANASQAWTWNLSAGDPTMTFGNDRITLDTDLTINNTGADILLTDGVNTQGLHLDSDGSLAFRSGGGTDILYLKQGGSLRAPGLASCAVITTDASGLLSCGSAGAGDITSVGDVASGAAFDGTQGTTLTFNNAGGDGTLAYDGTDFTLSHELLISSTVPAIELEDTTAGDDDYHLYANSDSVNLANRDTGVHIFEANDAKFELDSGMFTLDFTNNMLVVGTPKPPSLFGRSGFYAYADSAATGGAFVAQVGDSNGGSEFGAELYLQASNGTIQTPAVVTTDDIVGAINFAGFDGQRMWNLGQITGTVDGTPGRNDMPGELALYTTADGGTLQFEALSVDSSQTTTAYGDVVIDDRNNTPALTWQSDTAGDDDFELGLQTDDLTLRNTTTGADLMRWKAGGNIVIPTSLSFLSTTSYATTFQTGTQTQELTYTLPVSSGTAGQVLEIASVAGNTVVLEWDTDGGGGGNSFETIAVSGQSDVVADSATDTLTLAAGTNITLTTNAGTDTVTITASGGADTNADKIFSWPMVALPHLEPAESIPPIAKDAGTNVDMFTVDFDQTTDECRTFMIDVPPDITAGGTVTFAVTWYAASVTTNDVIWDVRHNSGVADGVDPDVAVTTETSGACTVAGTAGQIDRCTWTETQTNLAWAANDLVVGMVCRDANHASDTFAADAKAITFSIIIPRS